MVATAPVAASTALAQSGDRDPFGIILTNDEGGGKDVVLAIEEDCSDARARCAHRRWERDGETDASVGPIVTVNKVWIAKDVETAKAIYREQESRQREFPERPADEYVNGPFKFEAPLDPPAEEWTALSGCFRDACESTGRIDVHQRMIARKGSVVSVLYMFGRSRTTTPDLTVFFTSLVLDRV
jgi:hypothetical protein